LSRGRSHTVLVSAAVSGRGSVSMGFHPIS
jgi:hypothetical protein